MIHVPLVRTSEDGVRQLPAGGILRDSDLHFPPPRVMILQQTHLAVGQTRTGNPCNTLGKLRVMITDLPERYRLNPDFRCRIELLRRVPLRHKRTKENGSGFRHPSPWDGTTGAAGSGGTRGGGGGGTVARPTEWPVAPIPSVFAGLPFGGYVELEMATVIAPWFELQTVEDSYGGTSNTIGYFYGNNRRPSKEKFLKYKKGPFVGEFAFRYAIWDQQYNRWIASGMSNRIQVRPYVWPFTRDYSRNPCQVVRPSVPGMITLVARQARLSMGA